jgi:hypothetical protein
MAQRKNEETKFPRMYIEWEVKDKDGKLIDKGRKESQTWVANIIRLIWSLFNATTFYDRTGNVYAPTVAVMRDTGNNTRRFGTTFATVVGGVGDLIGIVVGSSDTAYDPTQYDLAGKILHGSGAGQLFYGASTIEPLTETPPTFQFRIIRSMTNQSSGSVTVKELGLFIRLADETNNARFYMLARDVLTSPITVPAGSTLTTRYIVSFSP